MHEVSPEADKVLCHVADIPDGGAVSAEIDSATGGFSLIVTRQGERVTAYHNECPHAGRRLDWSPGKFLIKDGTVICAAHGATFALDTGAALAGPCRSGLVPLPIQVRDGVVYLP